MTKSQFNFIRNEKTPGNCHTLWSCWRLKILVNINFLVLVSRIKGYRSCWCWYIYKASLTLWLYCIPLYSMTKNFLVGFLNHNKTDISSYILTLFNYALIVNNFLDLIFCNWFIVFLCFIWWKNCIIDISFKLKFQ